ncbi:MAG: alpha-ketoacid dehydrogenase subunit beta [Actinobacteria bacterium]|nr:alpha-ketoacid dehydrogenase subunit beta [Actinomycetota bacterium]
MSLKKITFREAVREALDEEMKRDPGVFLIGEDIGFYGGTNKVTEGLFNRYKNRVLDTPISESAIIGAALGAAITGFRPVAELSFMDFVAVAMDQIANQVAKIRYMSGGQAEIPLTIRTPEGAGRSAAAQHSQSLEAWIVHTPGLLVVVPSNPYNAKGLLKSSIRDNNPVIFIENKLLYNDIGEIPEEEYLIPLGKADILRDGNELTIIAYGKTVKFALAASDSLKNKISIEVIDLQSLVPMDTETIINSVKKTGNVLICHEAVRRCGFGSEIASIIYEKAFDYLDSPIRILGSKNTPIPFSPVLENYVIPDEKKIIQEINTFYKIS